MLQSLALIFLCGLLLGAIFQKFKLPSLIGMLITGIILGPFVLNLLDDTILGISMDLREFALIIILIRAGLSLELEDLQKIGRPAVLMSFVPACFEMAGTIFVTTTFWNFSLLDAGLLAAVIASASPAVIVPRMINLIENNYGTDKKIPQLILAGDSVDDIFNIVVFTALLGMADGQDVSVMQFINIPLSIVVGVLIGTLFGYLLAKFFRAIIVRDSIKVVIMLSMAFLLVAAENHLVGLVPFSGLVAVMTLGIVLLKFYPKLAKRISTKFSKLWTAAEVILFVLVGASVNINYVTASGFRTIILLIVVLLIRGIGILLCLIKTPLNWHERLFCIFTGIPKATVQAAIGGIPLAMGLASGEGILAAAVIAILFTAPIGAIIIDNSYKRLLNHKS